MRKDIGKAQRALSQRGGGDPSDTWPQAADHDPQRSAQDIRHPLPLTSQVTRRIRAEAIPARMTWELGAVSLRDATQLASRARNRLPVPEPFRDQRCTLLLVVRVENAQVLRIRPPVHARRAYVERGFAAR